MYKALRLMEQQKHLEPKFSEGVKDLATYLNDMRKSMFGDSVSRFSSVGDPFRSRVFGGGDGDSLSNYAGQAGQAFGFSA